MEQKKSQTKIVVISVIVLAVLVAAAALVWAFTRETPVTGAKTLTVTIVFADGSSEAHTLHTDAEYLRGALEEAKLVSGDESAYGLYIKTAGGYTADDSKQEWWCIKKDGEMLQTGVDTTVIADGESYSVELITGYSEF